MSHGYYQKVLSRINNFRKSRLAETLAPYGIAVISTVIAWWLNKQFFQCNREAFFSLLPNVLNIFGIAIAFVAACQGILLGIGSNHFLDRLRQLNLEKLLHRRFSETISSIFVALGLTALFLVLEDSRFMAATMNFEIAVWTWLFFCAIAAINSFRVTMFFSKIVGNR